MSEQPITDLSEAVRALGALPVPVGPEPQAPGATDELAAFRALELGALDGRVSASCGQPHHPTWLRHKDDSRGCPWCAVDGAHEDAIGANLARWEEEQENRRLFLAWGSARMRSRRKNEALKKLRARITELEAERHSTNEALDDAVQELRARGRESRKVFAERAREGSSGARTVYRMLAEDVADGEHYPAVHHDYRAGRDLPETGGAR